MKLVILSSLAVFIFFLTPSSAYSKTADYKEKNILVINSYHKGYEWSDSIVAGIEHVFKNAGVHYKIAYMDTKNKPSEEHKLAKALEIKKIIESEKPDVVITSDDNAVKYVLMPYFKNSKVPFIHTGVNWDGTKYGLPYKNATGMYEVALINPLLSLLYKIAKGKRVGALASDTESERASIDMMNSPKYLNGKVEARYFKTFEEFKRSFLELQKKVDLIYWANHVGTVGWNDDEAEKFVADNVKVPIGTAFIGTARFVMIGLEKIGNEPGEWAARAALKIMDGTNPSDIPEVDNKEAWLFLNTTLAKKIGVVFPPALLGIAAATITDVHKSFQIKDDPATPHYKYQK